MLNYETKWMSRDQIVDSTYQSALKLNRIKFKHGLIKEKKFKEIERRIGQAQCIIQAIDEQIEMGKSTIDCSNPESLQLSTICDKDELKWPVRILKFNVRSSSLKMLSLLRIKNILGLILWGELKSKLSTVYSPRFTAKT
jgi:hypothetical protein